MLTARSCKTGGSFSAHLIRLVKAGIRMGLGLAASAAEAGFSDQSHMNRCFRKVMGMTPGTFAAGVRTPGNC